MVSADTVLDYYLKEKNSIEDSVKCISKSVQDIFDAQSIHYRNIGVMTSVRTAPGHAIQLVKELEKLGILVYLYINDEEEGLSIMPPFTIDKAVLEKTLTMIAKKVLTHQ